MGGSSPTEGPRLLSKMQGLSANQSQQRKGNFPSRKRGFLRIRACQDPLPLSGRSGYLEDGPRHGTELPSGSPSFPQVTGELSPGFLQQEPACSTPAPPPTVGGALKRAMSEAEVAAPPTPPTRGGGLHVAPLLFLCIWEELWGNPMLGGEGGGVGRPLSWRRP